MKRILVIRLGAFGDFVLTFPAFADIRAHHAADQITLLTTAPFATLGRAAPWFDAVIVDEKPAWFNPRGLLTLRRALRGFDRVYDLQTSRRSSRYFLLAGRPPWSGIAAGCAFPHRNPARDTLHSWERQREQLADAGVPPSAPPDLAWLAAGGPVLPAPYALIVPATSGAHGGGKRWPRENFVGLARAILARGTKPVLVGGPADRADGAAIAAAAPGTLDLTGKTALTDLGGLAARAAFAVGGDTGPIHLAAAMGCPVVTLFSAFSDPSLAAPRGRVTVLRAPRLADLTVDRVVAALPHG